MQFGQKAPTSLVNKEILNSNKFSSAKLYNRVAPMACVWSTTVLEPLLSSPKTTPELSRQCLKKSSTLLTSWTIIVSNDLLLLKISDSKSIFILQT